MILCTNYVLGKSTYSESITLNFPSANLADNIQYKAYNLTFLFKGYLINLG